MDSSDSLGQSNPPAPTTGSNSYCFLDEWLASDEAQEMKLIQDEQFSFDIPEEYLDISLNCPESSPNASLTAAASTMGLVRATEEALCLTRQLPERGWPERGTPLPDTRAPLPETDTVWSLHSAGAPLHPADSSTPGAGPQGQSTPADEDEGSPLTINLSSIDNTGSPALPDVLSGSNDEPTTPSPGPVNVSGPVNVPANSTYTVSANSTCTGPENTGDAVPVFNVSTTTTAVPATTAAVPATTSGSSVPVNADTVIVPTPATSASPTSCSPEQRRAPYKGTSDVRTPVIAVTNRRKRRSLIPKPSVKENPARGRQPETTQVQPRPSFRDTAITRGGALKARLQPRDFPNRALSGTSAPRREPLKAKAFLPAKPSTSVSSNEVSSPAPPKVVRALVHPARPKVVPSVQASSPSRPKVVRALANPTRPKVVPNCPDPKVVPPQSQSHAPMSARPKVIPSIRAARPKVIRAHTRNATRPKVLPSHVGNTTRPEVFSPLASKPARPKVVHSPVDKVISPPHSRWSPIRHRQPLPEDEACLRCTKRGRNAT